jgi:hypothetical protein
MEDCTETWEACQLVMYGLSDDHPDRQCFNCGDDIDVDRIKDRDRTGGLLLCPECGVELPWDTDRDVPRNDWFNWARLEKTEYAPRPCFDEPAQQALRLDVSIADPRGGDIGLEVTETSSGDVLVKVENRRGMTYAPHLGTTVKGSYTVVRFAQR